MYEIVRGVPISCINFNIITAKSGRYRNKLVCDDIMCFDTETTNDYIIDGVPHLFNYENPDESKNAIKHSLVYVWQFSINNNIYLGRDLEDFAKLLEELNAYCNVTKFVYIHNLAFDSVFLENIFTLQDVFARKPRHPMTARIKEYNIELRCSYVLTNSSLNEWAKSQNLPVQKAVGMLDYSSKIRTPKTPLTQQEKFYCISDVQVMYYGLLNFRKKYGALYAIPLTHTGEMRKECEKVMADQTSYNLKVSEIAPQNLEEYKRQCYAFIGGTVLCNWLYKDRLVKGVRSYDIASSYPWVLLNNVYPMGRFYYCSKNFERYMGKADFLYIIHFKAKDVESKINCHFLSKSKSVSTRQAETDNGRIIRAKEVEYYLTSVDYELFNRCYNAEVEILGLWWCRAGYLNNEFRKFVLNLYSDKTTLKNVEGKEKEYMLKKQYINSCYGDFVTKIFADDVVYNNGEWDKEYLTEETFNKKLKTFNKKKYKNYKAFVQGVFVTAWARKRLWDGILDNAGGNVLDECMCYCDTDSLKVYNYKGDFFERENAYIFSRHEVLAKQLGVSVELFRPKDIKGIAHPIGVFEYEGTFNFRSTGCKQYMLEDEKGLHLTCAGVSKKAVACFKSIDEFTNDTTLTEKMLKEAGCEKLIPTYSNDYPVVRYDDGYICTYKNGINLMPTTFNISITMQDLFLLFTEVKERLSKFYYG